jgi:hypothetical protein
MGKWTGLTRQITALDAEAEPEAQRLFGPSYDARQRQLCRQQGGIDKATYRPWRKPKIERAKR